MDSLPNELLAAIAALGQEDRMQWTLSHVSRRFRSVMVGTPVLWTLVEVELDSRKSFKVLGLYLERSQECPIALTLRQRWALPSDSRKLRLKKVVPQRAAEILLHFSRVSRLTVMTTRLGRQLMLGPFRDLEAPNLQHLEVVNLFDEYTWSPAKLFLAGAPRLQVLRLYALTLELPVPQWAASLTHLELRRSRQEGYYETKRALKEFLDQCSSLVYLHLDVHSTVLEGRVHLPSLECLYLDLRGSERDLNLRPILDVFDTPSLTAFGANNVHGDQIFELFNAPSLPHPSFSALTSLSFVSTDLKCDCERTRTFPQPTPLLVLQLFPALSSLTLLNICFTPDILKGFFVPNSIAWPLPRTVALCPRADAMEDTRCALLAMMHSHVQHGMPIPAFKLAPALARLKDWRENGIAVEALDPSDVLRPFSY